MNTNEQIMSITDHLKYIRKHIPSIEVFFHGNYGEVRIDNKRTIYTSGNETISIILSYLNGLLEGYSRGIKKS